MWSASNAASSASAAARSGAPRRRRLAPRDQAQVAPVRVDVLGALRDRDDREVGARLGPPPDRADDALDAVRDLRDQDHVRAAGDPGGERQPARPVAHDLGEDDPVVAVGRAVEPVDGLGRDRRGPSRSRSSRRSRRRRCRWSWAASRCSARPWPAAGCSSRSRCRRCRPARRAGAGGRSATMVVGHVDGRAVDRSSGGACRGSCPRIVPPTVRMPASALESSVHGAVLGEAAEPVAEPDQLHPVVADGRLAEPADGRVEAGAVAARRSGSRLASSGPRASSRRWSAGSRTGRAPQAG